MLFLTYIFVTFIFWTIALFIYRMITPYDEIKLVLSGNNAAAVAYAGTAVGLAIPLASLAEHAVNLVDLSMWAVVALIVQLATYYTAAKLLHVKEHIPAGNLAVGIVFGAASLGAGILNAACLSY